MTDQTGTLRAFDPELIFENPYQHLGTRRTSGPEFDQFVADVRAAGGVRTPPAARPHPDVSGAVQLREGRRRFAAHKIAFPGQPFVVLVRQISDEDMLDDCIRENVFRADWNDIEIAEMMETYVRVHPNATNAELALKFNYQHPASVSNVRKLGRLPNGIKPYVAANQLPDAIARALVGVSIVNPKAAQKIADEVAAAPKSEKQETFENAVRYNHSAKLVPLGNWALDWLSDAPVEVETDLGDGDHFIGACAGCVFNVGGNRCARKLCRDEKNKMFAEAEAARVSAKLKIPAVAPGETTTPLFRNSYGDDDRARDLLNARKDVRAVLRLAPYDGEYYNQVERVLGSADLTLVTTDKNAIDAYFAERNAAAKSKNSAALSADKDTETDAARAKRIAQEQKEQDAKRAARATMWKSYYDATWLLESAARTIGVKLAETMSVSVFVKFIEHEFCNGRNARGAAKQIEERLEAEIKVAAKEFPYRAMELRLTHVALCVLANGTHDDGYRVADNEQAYMFESVRGAITNFCGDEGAHWYRGSFGVTLPDGWDVPPIHSTPFNCWHCGVFAGNTSEKLTKRDISEDGWIDSGDMGVFCSQEHQDEYAGRMKDNKHCWHCGKEMPKGVTVKKMPVKMIEDGWRVAMHSGAHNDIVCPDCEPDPLSGIERASGKSKKGRGKK